MRNQTQNTERVDFRATPDIKQLIEHAASIMGMDVSSFLRATVVPAAQQVIEGFEARVMTDRDRDRFLVLLDQSGQANETLKAASKRFQRAAERGEILP